MTISADRAFLLYGTTQVEPAPTELKAGRLTAKFSGGALRRIAYDGVEVLRAISFLVRDRDWGTYDPALSDLTVEQDAEKFIVRYRSRCAGPDGTELTIAATISGTPETLTFEASAETPTGFETNRCGFCILHPIVGLAGAPVTVEHVDGTVEETHLPDHIEPWQPFKEMRAITHAVLPGIAAECRMEGDTFEMEDQRNWSDASYKSYVRPLALPWPYRIAAGEAVTQKITLTIRDDRSESQAMQELAAGPVTLRWGEGTGILPSIGLAVSPDEAAVTLAALEEVGDFGAQELLLHFDPEAGHGRGTIEAFAALSHHYRGCLTMEIAVPCQRPLGEEMEEIAAFAHEAGLKLDAIIVSPSVDRQSTPPGSAWPDCPALDDVYTAAKTAFPSTCIGGGMLSYFTEINRKRVPAERLAFVSHATNPIVHAADDESVMQTLEALPFITRSLRAVYGEKPYRLGPSTIPMRQNPYGSRTMDNPDGSRIPMAHRDPRHNALFGAAFALGYAARVAGAGLERLTLSAVTGPFGLIAGPGEPMPKGGLRPLAHVVRALAMMADWTGREVVSSRPHELLALAGESRDGERGLLVANITSQTQTADLSALGLTDASLATLDETTVLEAAHDRFDETAFTGPHLTLRPYAVARLAWQNA